MTPFRQKIAIAFAALAIGTTGVVVATAGSQDDTPQSARELIELTAELGDLADAWIAEHPPSTVAPTTTLAPTTTVAPTTTTTAPPVVWPTAATTGPRGAGLAYAQLKAGASIDVTVNGTVIDAHDITGRIRVFADDVRITRTRIRHSSAYGVQIMDGADRTVLEYVEIVGTANTAAANIGTERWTCRFCDLSGAVDGAKAENDVLLERSYIHDQRKFSGTHNDGVQNSGGDQGEGPVIIRGNAIYGPFQTSTSAIIAYTNVGPINGMRVEGNFLYGGSYTVYLDDKGTGNGAPTNSAIIGNTFARGTSGLYRLCIENGGTPTSCNVESRILSVDDAVEVSGNRWDDGTPIAGA